MTGYTVHTGSNDNFRSGWEQIFGNGTGKAKKKTGRKAVAGKKAKRAKKKKAGS